MIPVLLDFIEAVKADDLDTAMVALEKVRKASVNGEWAKEDLSEDEDGVLTWATLRFLQLESCGPIVVDPDALVESIHDALDVHDSDLARKHMKALQGSWASGGPDLSEAGRSRFIEAYHRKEWEL